MVTGNVFSPAKAIGLSTSAALPAAVVKNISDSAQEQYEIDEKRRLEEQKRKR